MTQEEKFLLLKDLCSRLPYKPRVRYYYHSIGSAAINGYSDEGYLSYQNLEDFSLYPKYGLEKTRVYNISPYLRPMSYLTAEEICKIENIIGDAFTYRDGTLTLNTEEIIRIPIYKISNLIQFMYSRYLDFNNLIPMGLALEAPEGMYNI